MYLLMTPELEKNLKASEGLRLTAYRDTKGYYTVGYGHKLSVGKDWASYTINSDTAFGLLTTDANIALATAARLPEWASLDTQCRKDSVQEIVFNIGESSWRKFPKTRAAISDQNWKSAHDNLLDSLWAREVGEARSERIATQLLTGSYA